MLMIDVIIAFVFCWNLFRIRTQLHDVLLIFLSFKEYNDWIFLQLASHRDAMFALIKGIRSVYIVTLAHIVTYKYNKNVFS